MSVPGPPPHARTLPGLAEEVARLKADLAAHEQRDIAHKAVEQAHARKLGDARARLARLEQRVEVLANLLMAYLAEAEDER